MPNAIVTGCICSKFFWAFGVKVLVHTSGNESGPYFLRGNLMLWEPQEWDIFV